MRKLLKWGAIAFVGLIVIVVIATATSSNKDSSSNGNSSQSDTSSGSTKSADAGCGIKATNDCTPTVAYGKRVRVDALYWTVTSVKTAAAIGDQTYGLGAKADGRFVIVNLKVHSNKNESATLTDDAIQLDVNGNTYKADSDGTTAAIGNGDKPLFLEDIGPDATLRSKVVFDVPKSVLKTKIKVRFNELGLGSTHGYSTLPSLTGV